MTDTLRAPHGPSPHRARWFNAPRMTAVVMLLVMSGAAARRASSGPPPQSGSANSNATSHSARLDTAITDLFAHGSDQDRVRVIITLKPGAKRGLVQAL